MDSFSHNSSSDVSYCVATVLKEREFTHWAHVIYLENAATGIMHHIRQDDDMNNPNLRYARDEGRGVDEQDIYGRIVHGKLSKGQAVLASNLIDDFGADNPNIPEGSCQNWAVAALGILEKAGLVPSGTEIFWKGNIGLQAQDIKRRVSKEQMGGWFSGPMEEKSLNTEGKQKGALRQVDACYNDEKKMNPPVRKPGRIDMNAFEAVL